MDFTVLASASAVMVALLAGLALPIAVVLTYSRFGVGVSIVVLAFIIDTITLGDVALDVGLKLYYPDIFLLILAVAAVIRFIVPNDRPAASASWFIFCMVFLFSTLTGLISYGSSAGVDARPYFYLAATGLYGMGFNIEKEKLDILFKGMYLTTIFLIGLAFYRWAVYFIPIPNLLPPGGTYNIDGAIRVIYSHHVLLIAQITILVIFYSYLSKVFSVSNLLSPLLVGMVLVLQHRSVWLAAIVGTFFHLILGRDKQQSKQRKGTLIYMLVVLLIAGGSTQFSDSLQGISKQVKSGATTALAADGSVGERLQSWQELLKIWVNAGPRSVLMGQSFGADNTRYVTNEHGESIKIDYTAHNFYVQTLFNMGLIGLLAYLLVVAYALYGLKAIRANSSHKNLADAMIVIIITQLVYYIPYGSDYFQGLIFGVIVAFVNKNKLSVDSRQNNSTSPSPV